MPIVPITGLIVALLCWFFLYLYSLQLFGGLCVHILTLGLVYAHSYTVKFVSELNQKLQIKKQFGTYLSPGYG
jgi:hypothetical protein